MFHIVHISPHSDPQANLGEPDSGGQCIYEYELGLALSNIPDFQVTTFCRQTGQRPDESIINPAYTIKRISCGPDGFIPKEQIEQYIPEFVTKVEGELTKQPAENRIVHAHYWDGACSALSLKARSKQKLPMIWTPHSLGSVKQRKFAGAENEWSYNFVPRHLWEAYGAHVADSIILSTEKEKLELIASYATDADKVRVLTPGVNLDVFDGLDQTASRAQHNLPAEGKILLTIGRMVRNKGYHRAIEAFNILLQKVDEPLYLAVFGGSTTLALKEEKLYVEELHAQVKRLGLEDKVFFRPAVRHNQVPSVFAAADIFLMSSHYEPFGMVTIEAMNSCRPVVADNSGGSVDLITNNYNGILTDFAQPAKVATSILPLIKDPDIYERIAHVAKREAKRKFHWYNISAQFAQVYRQINRAQDHEPFQDVLRHNYFLGKYFR